MLTLKALAMLCEDILLSSTFVSDILYTLRLPFVVVAKIKFYTHTHTHTHTLHVVQKSRY